MGSRTYVFTCLGFGIWHALLLARERFFPFFECVLFKAISLVETITSVACLDTQINQSVRCLRNCSQFFCYRNSHQRKWRVTLQLSEDASSLRRSFTPWRKEQNSVVNWDKLIGFLPPHQSFFKDTKIGTGLRLTDLRPRTWRQLNGFSVDETPHRLHHQQKNGAIH